MDIYWLDMLYGMVIFIDRLALAKQGDNALGSIHLSVCQCALAALTSAAKSREE